MEPVSTEEETQAMGADAKELEALGYASRGRPGVPVPPVTWGIVGYRAYTDRVHFDRALQAIEAQYGPPRRVVSGGATGADTMARDWARERGIEFVEHLPQGRAPAAFLARNTLIVRDSTIVVAFLSERSRGTLDTIAKAKRAKKPVHVVNVD